MKGVHANGVDCSWIPLTWGRLTEDLVNLPPIDFIIASDCFYQKADFSDIMFTLAYLFEKNRGAVFWTTYQLRDCDNSLEVLLLAWDMTCREVSLLEFMAEDDPNAQ